MKRKALVIVPTYNEVENIESLIEGILKNPDWIHILVVDDNSGDGTADAVRKMIKKNPDRVHLLEREGKLGLGTAYLAGFEIALKENYDLAMTMDADHSHNPGHIREILHMAKIADVVVGSRYIAGGGIRNWGPHRYLLSWAANTLARSILGLKARDCTSGYRCYQASMLKKIDFQSIDSDGYSCLMELLSICQRKGAKIREIPIIFVDRRAGQSKISNSEIFKGFQTLWRIRKKYARLK